MPHNDEQDLQGQLERASRGLVVGAMYRHYRNQQSYTIIGFGLLETTEEPAVIYRAEYDEKVTWIRTIADFSARIEIDGRTVPRFERIDLHAN